MIHRARSLVTILALALPGVANADPMATFLRQDKYTYCDAKVLSALWKQSVSDAKVTIGAKLEAKAPAFVDDQLRGAREAAVKNLSARCSFQEAGFTYDDAKKLGALWKVDVNRAKAMVEDKILGGGEKSVRVMLRGSAAPIAQSNEDPTTTFLKQDKLGTCEVKLLSALWKTSAKEAKARIGLKLQTGNETYVRTELASARDTKKVKCTAADAGFTAYDVKRMIDLWQLTVADIERKITSGSAPTLRGMLADNPPPEGDLATFANQQKYTQCDAVMLAKLWKRSTSDAKAFIGAKLATKKSKRPLDKAIADARKNALKNQDARCSYYAAGLSYDDLLVLAKLWKKPEDDMKAEVALRIAKGQEAAIKAQVKKANANKPKQPPPPPPMPTPAGEPGTKPEPEPTKRKALGAPQPAPAPAPTAPATKAAVPSTK